MVPAPGPPGRSHHHDQRPFHRRNQGKQDVAPLNKGNTTLTYTGHPLPSAQQGHGHFWRVHLPRGQAPSAHTSCVSGSVSHFPGCSAAIHRSQEQRRRTDTRHWAQRTVCEVSSESDHYSHPHPTGPVQVGDQTPQTRQALELTRTFQAPEPGGSAFSRFSRSPDVFHPGNSAAECASSVSTLLQQPSVQRSHSLVHEVPSRI